MAYSLASRPTPQRRQRGVALMTVLLVVFLATLFSGGMALLQQRALMRSSALLHGQQARHYVLGAETWARQLLARDDAESDHLGEAWAAIPPAFEVTGGSLQGRIIDLQSRFNLNNLHPPGEVREANEVLPNPWLEVFERLLDALDLDPALAQAMADWIDEDEERRFPGGAERGDYRYQQPPLQPANRLLWSPSELRVVNGVTPEVYRRLAPYVTALPEVTALNVNTATPLLLQAVVQRELTPLEAWAEDLPQAVEVAAFSAALQAAGAEPLAEGVRERLTVASRYFMLLAEAVIGSGRARLSSLLQRQEDGRVIVLQRHLGAL